MPAVQRITSRNARYQQWESLLTNRNKRQRAREFLVQGVRPISLAVEHGWPVHALLYDGTRRPSRWAAELLSTVRAERVSLAPDLLAGLLSFLVLHRAGLVVLVHPETGHARADHTAHALWLGAVLPLELSVLPE